MTLQDWGNLGQLIEAIAAVVGLIYIGLQVRAAHKTSKGQFLLSLDDKVRQYDDVHRKLLNESWYPSNKVNMSKGEPDKINLHSYLGLFERIKILIDDKSISLQEVRRLYGYRVQVIVFNRGAYEELETYPDFWIDFIKLCRSLAELEKCERSQIDLYPDIQKFIEKCETLPDIKTKCEEDFRYC